MAQINTKRKGTRFETKVKQELESKGYLCMRQSASRFPDIVAIRDGVAFVVECKTNKYLSKDEKLKGTEIFNQYCDFLIAYPVKEGRRVVIEYMNLNNEKIKI
jgi:Holliday junction resolvase